MSGDSLLYVSVGVDTNMCGLAVFNELGNNKYSAVGVWCSRKSQVKNYVGMPAFSARKIQKKFFIIQYLTTHFINLHSLSKYLATS